MAGVGDCHRELTGRRSDLSVMRLLWSLVLLPEIATSATICWPPRNDLRLSL